MADGRTLNTDQGGQPAGTVITPADAPPLAQDVNGVGIDPWIDDETARVDSAFDRILREHERRQWITLALFGVGLYLLSK